MHFSWPLFRNYVDLLNSCFTGVLEQEMTELDLNHTVGGRERKKQQTRRKRKKKTKKKNRVEICAYLLPHANRQSSP